MGREPRGAHWDGLEALEVWLVLLWRGIEICATLFPWPAVKNQVTGSFILNPKGKEATSRTFTAMGLEWEYAVEDAKESLKTSGPLPEAIAVLVSPDPAQWLLPSHCYPSPVLQLTVSAAQPAQAGGNPSVLVSPGAWPPCFKAGRMTSEEGKINGCLTVPSETPHTGSLFSLIRGLKWGPGGAGGTWLVYRSGSAIIQCPCALWHYQQVCPGAASCGPGVLFGTTAA